MAVSALAGQYIYDTNAWWRPFVEGGGWITPNAELSYDRTYANGAGAATGVGNTRGDLSYYFGRAGLIFGETQTTQLVVSGEVGQQKLKLDAYSETDGPSNPFPAAVSAGTDRMNVAKARLQATHTFDSRFDATVFGAWAQGFDRKTDLVANVLAFGPTNVTVADNVSWFEYGARVGYKLSAAMTFDVFANGVAGDDGINSEIHAGAGLRVRF